MTDNSKHFNPLGNPNLLQTDKQRKEKLDANEDLAGKHLAFPRTPLGNVENGDNESTEDQQHKTPGLPIVAQMAEESTPRVCGETRKTSTQKDLSTHVAEKSVKTDRGVKNDKKKPRDLVTRKYPPSREPNHSRVATVYSPTVRTPEPYLPENIQNEGDQTLNLYSSSPAVLPSLSYMPTFSPGSTLSKPTAQHWKQTATVGSTDPIHQSTMQKKRKVDFNYLELWSLAHQSIIQERYSRSEQPDRYYNLQPLKERTMFFVKTITGDYFDASQLSNEIKELSSWLESNASLELFQFLDFHLRLSLSKLQHLLYDDDSSSSNTLTDIERKINDWVLSTMQKINLGVSKVKDIKEHHSKFVALMHIYFGTNMHAYLRSGTSYITCIFIDKFRNECVVDVKAQKNAIRELENQEEVFLPLFVRELIIERMKTLRLIMEQRKDGFTNRDCFASD